MSSRLADRRPLDDEGRAAALLRRWAGLELPSHRWPLLRASLVGLAPDGTVRGALDRLEAGEPSLRRQFLAGATIPETYLFRHPEHYEALAEHARAAVGRSQPYRVLSAGCATGEEAWSAAAVLDAVADSTGLRWQVRGWDLDEGRLARARLGRYSSWSARRGLLGYGRAFEAEGRGWRVHPRLRGGVGFEAVNLKRVPAKEREAFDAAFLRNVAIYWTRDCAAKMIAELGELLRPGGLLFLGASEPEALDRREWSVSWRGHVRVACRRPSPERARRIGVASAKRGRRRGRAGQRSLKPRRSHGLPASALGRIDAARAERLEPPRARSAPVPVGVAAVKDDVLAPVRELADRGEYGEALALLDARPLTPEAEPHRWRGILCLNLARPGEARSALRRAVFLEPGDLASRRWLAVALSACGEHEAAARERRNLAEVRG